MELELSLYERLILAKSRSMISQSNCFNKHCVIYLIKMKKRFLLEFLTYVIEHIIYSHG